MHSIQRQTQAPRETNCAKSFLQRNNIQKSVVIKLAKPAEASNDVCTLSAMLIEAFHFVLSPSRLVGGAASLGSSAP